MILIQTTNRIVIYLCAVLTLSDGNTILQQKESRAMTKNGRTNSVQRRFMNI